MQEYLITKFVNLKDVIIISEEVTMDEIIYIGNRIDIRPECSCGNRNVHIHDYRTHTIKLEPIYGRKVTLHVTKQRYKCPICKKKKTSPLNVVRKNAQISYSLESTILNRLKDQNFTLTAKDVKLSISSVMRYFNHFVQNQIYLEESFEVLHFDEFKGTSDKGTYQLAVLNGGNANLVEILPDRKEASFRKYLESLGTPPLFCTIDLWAPYRRAIYDTFPDVTLIADKFHYVRQMQWALRDVRVRVQKHKKKKSLKKYWKLLAKNSQDLNAATRMRVEELTALDEEIAEAYQAKVKLEEALKTTGIEAHGRFDDLLDYLQNSKITELNQVYQTYENWYVEIINSLYHPYSNGVLEGKNNKIKTIKRQAFGFKRFDTLKGIMLHKCA